MALTDKQQEILEKVEQKETEEDILFERCRAVGICHKCGGKLEQKTQMTLYYAECYLPTFPQLGILVRHLCPECDKELIEEIAIKNASKIIKHESLVKKYNEDCKRLMYVAKHQGEGSPTFSILGLGIGLCVVDAFMLGLFYFIY
jgi:hypothetical protein